MLALMLLGMFASAILSAQTGSLAELPTTDSAWGFDRSDVRPDRRILFGVLPNGMRYAIMPNRYPRGAASIRLRIATGAASEAPGQAGFAHLLEHMAFRGSRNIPDGALNRLLEEQGVHRWTNYNARTRFYDTVYEFDLPRTDDGRLDAVLRVIRDIASELTLSAASLESERLIVLEEMRARNVPADRLAAAEFAFFVPEATIAHTPIGGTTDSIRAADAVRLRSFYGRHYRPDNTTVIVVGDIDAEVVETQIRRLFSDWQGQNSAQPPARASVETDRPNSFQLFAEPDAPTRVSIATLRPIPAGGDTLANRERVLLETLAGEMLTRRLARLAGRGTASFAAGRASSYDYHGTAWITRIDIDARNRDWRAAVQAAEHELRRALIFGFSASELDEQLAVSRQALNEASGPQQSRTLASELVRAIDSGFVATEPLRASGIESYLADVDLGAVNGAFRSAWSTAPWLVFLSHDDPNVGLDEVRATWSDSQLSVPAPPTQDPLPRFAYESFGIPGSVVRDRRHGRLNVRSVRFANNVRLNILPTHNEEGRVHLSLRIGGGLLELPAEPEGLATFMTSIFAVAGTGRHDFAELQSIFAGRAVRGGLDVTADAFGATRVTNEEDLKSQLAVLAAYVIDPGYRPEAEQRWRGAAATFVAALGNSSEGVMTRDLPRILAAGDRRFGIGSADHMQNLTFASLRPAVADALATGAIEIGIVGDVDEERAIAAVASTFGALPRRRASRPDYASSRSVRFPHVRETITLTHSGRAEDGRIGVYWPTAADGSARSWAELELLAEVVRLELLETLRERMGATYSPDVSWSPPEGIPTYQYISLAASVDPANMDVVLHAVDELARRLSAQPINAQLLNRARNPLLERLRESRQSNEQLLNLVARAQSCPHALDRLDDMLALLPSISVADLRQATQRYLRTDSALRVRVVPSAR